MHERAPAVDLATLPNRDIRVTDDFLRRHSDFVPILGGILFRSALNEPGATDWDVRDAIEALIRTYRTLQSGLYYDSRPENAVAARIFDNFQQAVAAVRGDMQKSGATMPGDTDLLRLLVFMQEMEAAHNNGRKLSRAFLDALRALSEQPREERSSLIV